ncbi:MAG: hypothetical protein ACLFPW_06980 [Spirochaetaceae bacterium]
MKELDRIHFFSWVTRVSIELPVGFEEQREDPDNNAAIYADDLEDDEEPGARVMTKMSAVPSTVTDAYRSIAAASVEAGSRTVENREECSVDGVPGIRQVFSYHDEEAGVRVLRHETYAQVGTAVFSITCLAPARKNAEYAAAFDHASRSARIVLTPSEGEAQVSNHRRPRSFSHPETRISAQVPVSWLISEPTEHSVRFSGPPETHFDGSRATFSIALGEPDGFGPEGFADFCDESLGRLEEGVPGFTLRSLERYSLSSLVDVHAVWYAGRWDSAGELLQLQALGLLDRYHLYLINAAAPLPLAEQYAPIFDGILRTLRVLPRR